MSLDGIPTRIKTAWTWSLVRTFDCAFSTLLKSLGTA